MTQKHVYAGVLSKELNRQKSLAAVSLSDLIDTALQVYGIPSTVVRRITGTRNVFSEAPFYAQELHPGSVNGGHMMLIGDAAMKVLDCTLDVQLDCLDAVHICLACCAQLRAHAEHRQVHILSMLGF